MMYKGWLIRDDKLSSQKKLGIKTNKILKKIRDVLGKIRDVIHKGCVFGGKIRDKNYQNSENNKGCL